MTAQQLKNSILQMAIQGKLVSQDPSDEPATLLLKKIKAGKDALIKSGKLKHDKHESVITRDEEGHFIEKKEGKSIDITDEIPFDVPETWEWVRLGAVFQHNTGKALNSSNRTGQLLEYITTSNLYWNRFELDKLRKMFFTDSELEKCTVQRNDLLVCEGGDFGRAAIWAYDYPMCIQNHIHRLRAFSEVCVVYFYYLFYFYKTTGLINGTGIGIKGLSSNVLHDLLFPLPPLAEQKRIVAKIEELFPHLEEYDRAETEARKLNEKFPDMLKKSILQSAIQGKLVLQDPTDEPASELLKRIKAEKNALIKSGVIKRDKRESVIIRDEDGHFIEKKEGKSIDITDEIPFDVPDSWEWVRLGSLFHISPRNDVEDEVDVGFMPMPLLQDGFRNSHSFEVRKWRQVKNGFTHFMNGDIVIAKITPCFQNRKSAIISNLPNEYGAGTTELHVLRDETHLLCLRFFLWLFKTHAFIESGVKHFTGTAGQQRIGKDFLSDYLVPLPPLAEQERIVEKLEKSFLAINELK